MDELHPQVGVQVLGSRSRAASRATAKESPPHVLAEAPTVIRASIREETEHIVLVLFTNSRLARTESAGILGLRFDV